VHRDLKPDNLLVGCDGRLRVIDFGIACLAEDSAVVGTEEAPGETRLDPLRTHHGPRFGTLAYLMPEALEGAPDVRGDVFALGLVLFELLLGRPARTFGGSPSVQLETAALLAAVREPIQLPIGELPRGLAAILRRALAQDPAGRYPTAEALGRDFLAYRDSRPIDAMLAGGTPFQALGRLVRRHRPFFAAALLAHLGLGLGLSMRLAEREATQFARAEELRAAAIRISLRLVTDLACDVAHLSGGGS